MADKQKYYWIKLRTDFFDQDAIDFLMSQENGSDYVVLYQMLCLATANSNGSFCSQVGEMLVPYDVKKIVRETKYFTFDTVAVALELFKKIGLIYEQDGGILKVSNYDLMVGSEAGNANAQRQKRFRERQKQKQLGVTKSNASNVTENNEEIRDKSIDKDIDIDSNIINNITLSPASGDEVKKSRIYYQEIVDLYNDTCHSLPKVKALSDNRKRAIKKIIDKYGREKLEEVFELTERSDFLKGKTGSWRGATFDWIVKEQNFVKILEGNYESRGGARKGNYDDVLEMLGGK